MLMGIWVCSRCGLLGLPRAGIGFPGSLGAIPCPLQFQEFMRKIPSATNLAAAMTEGTESASGEQAPPGGGVPRVPSLDFIK